MKTAFAAIILILSGVFLTVLHVRQQGLQKLVFKAEVKQKKEDSKVLSEFTVRYSNLLKKYVDSSGVVSYRLFKEKDLLELDRLIGLLSHFDTKSLKSKEEALAFYINLYNFLTIRAILEFYPLQSIKEYASPVGFNIWKDVYIGLHDRQISLDQIEHEILRKMSEPRIHFAIVCASIGCPKLLNEPYTPNQLEGQLAKQSSEFFDQERNFQFDLKTNEVKLSAIIQWFGVDFGSNEIKILETLDSYLSPAQREKITQPLSDFEKISYLDYDWNLNGR